MLIDEVIIDVYAGNGGHGSASFRREKFIPRGGPDGGNGGKGGDVYFIGVSDLGALLQFQSKKKIEAEDGKAGAAKKCEGKGGDDLLIRIPIGTSIIDLQSNKTIEIEKVDQKVLIAKGGNGGRGNFELRSASNQAPPAGLPGKPGQSTTLQLNLRFIADIGFIGLPNAGKSSLLNALTNAQAKIGNYPFTTLEPNLGKMNDLILADIPGLIEGAHEGKGLGVRFLKHISKTKLLVHCIDIESPDALKDYKTIRHELESYDATLLDKPEIIILTKTDVVTEKEIKVKISKLKTLKKPILTCSVLDAESLDALKKTIESSVS